MDQCQGLLPTPPLSYPRASSDGKDALDMSPKLLPATEDTTKEAPIPLMLLAKQFLYKTGAFVGLFNKLACGALGNHTASTTTHTDASQYKHHRRDGFKVGKGFDFAASDISRVGPDEGKEREEEEDSSLDLASDSGPDLDSDSDSDSGSDFHLDNTTAEKDNSSMSDDDMLGNPFQLMDVKILGMPEWGGEHHQVGAVEGEGKAVDIGMGPSESMLTRNVNNAIAVPAVGPQYGRTEDAASVKGKAKAPGPDPLAFSWPLEHHFFMPSPLVPQRLPGPSEVFTPGPGQTTGYEAEHNDTTSQLPYPQDTNPGRICELQDLQDSIKSKIQANIWQEIGKIVKSSVAIVLEKALPDLLNHCAEGGARPSSSPTTPSHNKFKKSVQELGKELLHL
ncbi:hypothetical protein EV401DRAFT_2082593 [Pisolithus croceorrhizus]|nr:hypothetical protein EV401DRAFT_2082593 [Pisolithus croceorrhizus]